MKLEELVNVTRLSPLGNKTKDKLERQTGGPTSLMDIVQRM